jgi:acetyl esterase/lipase
VAGGDCIDVAEHLIDEPQKYGGKLLFMGGESSGANLAALTIFQLIRSRPDHVCRGMVLVYGNYSLALGMPSMVDYDRPIMLNHEIMRQFMDVYTPGWSAEERRNPLVSPLFEDLPALAAKSPTGRLPPALFLCGTNDPLIDETLLMSVKWMATGSEAIVKIFPGAPHVFNGAAETKNAKESFSYEAEFLQNKLESDV